MKDVKRKCQNPKCGATVISPANDGRCPICGDVVALMNRTVQLIELPFAVRKALEGSKKPCLTASDIVFLRELKVGL